MTMGRVKKLSIIVYSSSVDRVHYALAAASAAAASNMPATLFFTMSAIQALTQDEKGNHGWSKLGHSEEDTDGAAWDANNKEIGVAGFEELLEACVALEVKFIICEMGIRIHGINPTALRKDIPIQHGGLVTFFTDADAEGSIIFI